MRNKLRTTNLDADHEVEVENFIDSIPALGTKKDGFMPSFFIAVTSKHLVFWIRCSCRYDLDIHS